MIAPVNPPPCRVPVQGPAGGEFSVLYQNRYLYSKYAPSRAILRTVSQLDITENTLILGFSPALCYGLRELAEKLAPDCFILLIETSAALYDFFVETCGADFAGHPAIGWIRPGDIQAISRLLEQSGAVDGKGKPLPPPGTFRRCLRVDLSGGTEMNPRLYEVIHQTADNAISRFWKNRLTLMRFGRLFSRNLFKNLPLLVDAERLPIRQITKPVLVIGAGPSAEKICQNPGIDVSRFYTVAADTVLPALRKQGITPDLTVQVECQRAVEQAYYSAASVPKKKLCLAFDLVSLPGAAEKFASSYYCFFTEFTPARFIERLKSQDFLPVILPPMGSVGLSATYIALLLRQDEDIPVFVTGLDFSFPAGKTHCRGAPSHTRMLLNTTRLSPVGNPEAAFKPGAFRAKGKNGETAYTDAALAGYCESFKALFSRSLNLYDAGSSGLSLGIQAAEPAPTPISLKYQKQPFFSKKEKIQEKIRQYVAEETTALGELKAILTGPRQTPEAGEDTGGKTVHLRELLKDREYLYLHFPEGYRIPLLLTGDAPLDISLLKRIRAEIDGFLKVLAH
ncbi:MAG: DUF115 domain-containing protein [Treponema sp.]|nr:DUF115 domain-containing protein [Treponema sp.]